ncbi:unnamed protein product [Clonostachys rosea f. rosea IK726]|uniref:EKC/KEOPS complex subunit BUD32 n=2 Tax=Bionectria ochroleuca TaxID=29856 RepID=A0A0B7KG22_BIOOC|nr:unnamed protein product [Clonostachys rosea f. rosea IK726]
MSTDDLTGLVLGLKLETEFAQDGSTVHTIPQEETSESLIERWVPDESPTLGQKGGSSGVWLERCDKNGTRKRVVKEIGKFFDGQVRIDYARELEALGLISSSKSSDLFVGVFGWFENQESVFISMEYLELGDLSRYLSAPFPVDQTHQIISQLLQALEFLHSHMLTHQDLSPSNILIAAQHPEWIVKIAGFGSGKYRNWDYDTVVTLPMKTVEYMSPEKLGIRPFDSELASSADMWSLGVLIFKLLTNGTPFRSVYDLIEYNSGSIPLPGTERLRKSAPQSFQKIIEELLTVDPQNRPSARSCNKRDWGYIADENIVEGSIGRTSTSYSVDSLEKTRSSVETSSTSIHSGHTTTSSDVDFRRVGTRRSLYYNTDLAQAEKEVGEPEVSRHFQHPEKEVVSEALASNILTTEKEVLHQALPTQVTAPRVAFPEKEVIQIAPSVNRGPVATWPAQKQSEISRADSYGKNKPNKLQKLQETLFRAKSKDASRPRLELLKCQQDMSKLAAKDPSKAADRGLKYIRSNFKTSFPLFQKCDECIRCYFQYNGFSLTARTRGPFCQVHRRQSGIMPFSPIHFFAMARQDVGTATTRYRSCVEEVQCLIELAKTDLGYLNYPLQFSVTNSDGLMEMTPLWLAALDKNQEVVDFMLSLETISVSEGVKSLCLLSKMGIPPSHHDSILQVVNMLPEDSARRTLREYLSSNGAYPNMPWVFASTHLLDQVLVKSGEGSANDSVPLQTREMLLPVYLPLVHALAIFPIATTKSQFPYASRLELFKILLKHGADTSRVHDERGSVTRAYSQRLSRGLDLLIGSLPAPRTVDIICDEVSGLVQIIHMIREQRPEERIDGLSRLSASFRELNASIFDETERVKARHKSYASRGTIKIFSEGGRVPELETLDYDHKQTMFNICTAAEHCQLLLKDLGVPMDEDIMGGHKKYEPRRYFEGTEIQVHEFLGELEDGN